MAVSILGSATAESPGDLRLSGNGGWPYGIIYFEVARVPERGWLLAAVGLLGEILGPIGLGILIWKGTWPKSTIVLCATNDLIWWIPFAIYLYDAWPFQNRER